MKKSVVIKPIPFIFQLILSLGGGFLIGMITRNNEMFQSLNKPPLTPPPIVFIIAWSIFYILMAISATIILSSQKGRDSGAIRIYYVQLMVNFLWPIFFFSFGFLTFSFVWILLLIALVIAMIVSFYKVNKTAALIQIPYLIWLLFAAYLNLGFAVLN